MVSICNLHLYIVVPDRNDPDKIKFRARMGNIDTLPRLPQNPTPKQQKAYDKDMAKINAKYARLPDLERVYYGEGLHNKK